MSATNFMEAAVGDALFLAQPFPTVTAWNVCLYSQTPNEANTLGNEIIGNGYAPVSHNPGGGRWIRDAAQSTLNETVYRNGVAVQFPIATADWPNSVGFGLKNQNGDLCFATALSAPKPIKSGEQAVFLAGELEIKIG
ncbi:MAG: hypothetical protein HC889_16870 [Synechococcaceae cyanobacterium SM1_2_3]|nr:hypothetical protein [Synechococcaceae cyanobacterium SM1_2_3]